MPERVILSEGVILSQEQFGRLQAHIARDAASHAQEDVEYFRENALPMTDILLRKMASHRAEMAWAVINAELVERMSAGMSLEDAVEDYLAPEETETSAQDAELEPLGKDEQPMSARYQRVERARRFLQQHNPIPKILVGLLLLLLFIVGSILHIMTSEAFFLGGDAINALKVDWQIVLQPAQLATGTLPGGIAMQKAVMWGWGIEAVFLICIIGYDKLHKHVKASSRAMAKIFRYGTVVLVFFDGWTDFNYGGGGTSFWGQLAFALINAFIVFYFGTGGFHLIMEGLTELADELRGEGDDDGI